MKMLRIKQTIVISRERFDAIMKDCDRYDIVKATVSGDPRTEVVKKEVRVALSVYAGFAFTERATTRPAAAGVERSLVLFGPGVDNIRFEERFDPEVQEYAYFAERGTQNRIEIAKPCAVELE